VVEAVNQGCTKHVWQLLSMYCAHTLQQRQGNITQLASNVRQAISYGW
jgi:hypothetical protein